MLRKSKPSIENHLHPLGCINRFDVWVPCKLSKKTLTIFLHSILYLMKIPFLKQIVMGNKNWIPYSNVEWKRSWGKWNGLPPTTPKFDFHSENMMLCIWWNWKGGLYYELLLENRTINSNKCCSPFDQLKAALKENNLVLDNRKHRVFHQDNTRLHISLMARQNLLQLGWEGLIHPPYSPDTASSDFHLIQSFQNSLNGKVSIPWKIVRSTWNSFLHKMIKSFGTMEL